MLDIWNANDTPRLILGTVQLGMPYGIANVAGKPSDATACRIVETAIEKGIRHFDTAQAYGESEQVLGDALRRLGVSGDVSIATKLAATLNPRDPVQIQSSVEQSLARLQVDRLWCLMLHEPSWLAVWDEGLGDTLQGLVAHGKVAHLGVSLRTVNDAPAALSNDGIEVIQAPCNAWDRRMAERGHLDRASRQGKLCCIRSVYLQGLLTLSPDAVAQRLPRAIAASSRWWDLAHELGVSPKELAMRYALSLAAPLVVGAESVEQLEDSIRLASLEPLTPATIAQIAEAIDPLVTDEIIEPNRWEGAR